MDSELDELLSEIAFFHAFQEYLRYAEDLHYQNNPEEKPEVWPPPSWGPNWKPHPRLLKKLQ